MPEYRTKNGRKVIAHRTQLHSVSHMTDGRTLTARPGNYLVKVAGGECPVPAEEFERNHTLVNGGT